MSDPSPVPAARHTSHLRLFVLLGIGLIAVIAVFLVVATLLAPKPQPVNCLHPGCGRPPTPPKPSIQPGPAAPSLPNVSGAQTNYLPAQPETQGAPPVRTFPRFTAPDGSWSVAYPPEIAPLPANAKNVDFTFRTKEGVNEIALIGGTAGNATPQDVVQQLIQKFFPGATLAYQVPNAMVGYQAGYGEFDDFTPQGGNATYSTGRALAVAAIKNGVVLVMLAIGPKHIFKPPEPDGHPSGANLIPAAIAGPFINSFMWKGDPPR
jgi:hypothetical protein